jgi:hypothetical protein
MITMIGCASSRPIMSESSNHEREHSNNQSHVEHTTDSTLIDRLREVITRNDTVFIHDSIYIYKFRDRQVTDTVHDTLYINNTDTIRLTITNEVEKPIADFVRNSCIALWVIIGVAILALVGWIWFSFATGKISWGKILSWIIRR